MMLVYTLFSISCKYFSIFCPSSTRSMSRIYRLCSDWCSMMCFTFCSSSSIYLATRLLFLSR